MKEHIVSKIRTFAIPETESGQNLRNLADKVEHMLRPSEHKAEDYKDNAALSRAAAQKAIELAEEVEDLEFDF